MFSLLHLLTVAVCHLRNWKQMGLFLPPPPPPVFTALTAVCLLTQLLHWSCLWHASDFLAKPLNCASYPVYVFTHLHSLLVLCFHESTLWLSSTQPSAASSSSFQPLPVLSLPKSHGPNLWELLKSSHLVWETCQWACCAHWPDLGGEDKPNKMTYLPLLYSQPLGSHDTSETSGITNT